MKTPTILIGEPQATEAQYKAINEFIERNPSATLTGEKGFYSNGVCMFDFFWRWEPKDIVSVGYNPDGTFYDPCKL